MCEVLSCLDNLRPFRVGFHAQRDELPIRVVRRRRIVCEFGGACQAEQAAESIGIRAQHCLIFLQCCRRIILLEQKIGA